MDSGVISETRKPGDIRFPPKPGHLPLGVMARGALGLFDRLLEADFAPEDRPRLGISQRPNGFRVARACLESGEQSAGLLEQPLSEHVLDASIDAVVEPGPLRIETNSQDAEASQALSPPRQKGGERPACREAHLDRSDDLRGISRPDPLGARRVEAEQEPVEEFASASFRHAAKARPKPLRALRPLEQPLQEGSKVESRSTDEDRQLPALAHLHEGLLRHAPVIPGRKHVARLNDVEEVVRNAAALFGREFPRSKGEAAIDLDGVEVQDLASQALGELETQRRLPHRRRANYGDEWVLRSAMDRTAQGSSTGSFSFRGYRVHQRRRR